MTNEKSYNSMKNNIHNKTIRTDQKFSVSLAIVAVVALSSSGSTAATNASVTSTQHICIQNVIQKDMNHLLDPSEQPLIIIPYHMMNQTTKDVENCLK